MKTKIIQLFLTMTLLCLAGVTNAQMRMGGTSAPEPNAILDLNANNTDNGSKGLLLPRVALVATTNASPLTAHVKGMFVYNTATVNDVSPGAYYNNGTKWIRSGGDNSNSSSSESNVRQLEIEINERIDTRSVIYHGETSETSPDMKVLSIEPVFSDDMIVQTHLAVNSSVKLNTEGTAVKWSVRIMNANIDSSKSCELQKVIISYTGDDELKAGNIPNELMRTYVLVGQ
jgi:hypothetical protein